MSTFEKVVPGKVLNHGIISGETFPQASVVTTSPAHYPDFAAVTPKGPVERKNTNASDFTSVYGNVTDPYSSYYNPITYGIQMLGKNSQTAFGFKRLTNNNIKARSVRGIIIFESDAVPTYERDVNNDYVYGTDGKPKLKATAKGILAGTCTLEVTAASSATGTLKPIKVTVAKDTGNLKANAQGTFYPLIELTSGIGKYYNSMYNAIGHGSETDWNEIARFVLTNGVYPFDLTIGRRSDAGLNIDASKLNGGVVSNFTLYDVNDTESGVAYSLRQAIGAYTGKNVNRPVEAADSPFDDSYVYQANLSTVMQLLYNAEYVNGQGKVPAIRTTRLPKEAIMNPFDLVDHFGKPYQNIVYTGSTSFDTAEGKLTVTRVSMDQRALASGAIDPYTDKDGKYPTAPSTWIQEVDGVWVADNKGSAIPTQKQYWQMNQQLAYAYYQDYLSGKEFRDVIRNRTSFIWDLGYNQDLKDLIIGALAKRKDFIPVLCATQWLREYTEEQTYSVAQTLNTKMSTIPESEEYGAPSTRGSINLWTGLYMDEPTYQRFSLNIDLMCAFARAGGSMDGRISFSDLPTEGKNAWLQLAHTPNVGFEDDDPAAQNLLNGSVTLRPVNLTQWKRPALPTVYYNTDSVLKDLPNVWYGVVMEKILQDQWILVSGSVMSAANYLATVHDNADKQIHNQLGACLSQWDVQVEFRETNPNSRSRMFAKVVYWVGKAKYMMDAVLEARNEAELS